MFDHHQASRQDFIRRESDQYADKRESAIAFLRANNLYVLDKDSRRYEPCNKRFPQHFVPMKDRL